MPESVQESLSGLRIVHLQQFHLGIPVQGGRRAVRFDARGRIVSTTGRTIKVPSHLEPAPLLPVSEAVAVAARYLASQVEGLSVTPPHPQLRHQFPTPPFGSVLRKRPFDDPVTAQLAFHPGGTGPARLSWVVQLSLPAPGDAYEVVISADGATGEVLFSRRRTACALFGHVFEFDPTTPAPRQPFPRDLASYPAFGSQPPAGFPWPWCDRDETAGNNVVCYPGNDRKALKGSAAGSDVVFQFPIPDEVDQSVLNAFYVCNLMHDFFYLLGFDEKAGNFQRDNRTGLGKRNDQLVVRVFDSDKLAGGASMTCFRDGSTPRLSLGRIRATQRHTALDAGVVIHEFVHGVTSRLAGGLPYDDPLAGRAQSEAIGEGYSDFFALTIVNHYRRAAGLGEDWTIGGWVANDAQRGLRPEPYVAYARTYADLANGSIFGSHAAGQVWCATLLDARQGWIQNFGGTAAAIAQADLLVWRLVLASLPLLRVAWDGPHCLDARDALVAAFDNMANENRVAGNVAAHRAVLRQAFAGRRMGPSARSRTADFAGITPS